MIASRFDRRIFVDTSAYYAAVDSRDASHVPVSTSIQSLIASQHRFVTTNAIVFELHGLLLNRLGREVAFATLRELRASQTIVRVRDHDERRAVEILAQYQDKLFSLTDALSFAVMGRLGISVALTLDRHFSQFGWETVAFNDPRDRDR